MDRAALLRATALTVAGSLLLMACGSGTQSSAAAPTTGGSALPSAADPSDSPAPTGPPTVGLQELAPLTVSLEGGPDWPTVLDGSVWILAPDGPLTGEGDPFIYRLDAESGEEQARVDVGGRLCQGIAAGFGSLWVCTDDGLIRIDPATNEAVAEVQFQVAQAFLRPVMGADRVWMLAGNVVADRLVEIDPASNEVVATHRMGHAAAGLAFGDGALWATAPDDGLLLRIDPRSGEVTEHASGLAAPVTIAFGAGSLWVGLHAVHGGDDAAPGEPTIARISAADGSVEAEVVIGSTTMGEGDIWASDEEVWVRAPADPFLVRVNPASNEVDYGIAGFQSGGSLTVVDGVIWATSVEFQTAWRIEP